jgi:hypothetical protein
MLETYEKATNMRGNKTKFQGIQCGTLRDQPIPQGIPPQIKWLKLGEHAKILGVPLWTHDQEEEWWEEKFLQIKTKMANWDNLAGLSLHGRVMLANAMIHSIPRYWMQSSRPPDHIIEGLEADVYHLLWAKDHEFDVQAIGSSTKNRPYIEHSAIYNRRKCSQNTGLGMGLLNLQSHARALRVKWILRYLDASEGQWKLILDAWIAKSRHGRGNIIPQTPIDRLIGPLKKGRQQDSCLPEFWKAALLDLRELELKRRQTSPLGAESQPLWNNSMSDVQLDPEFRKVSQTLRTHTVAHLTNDDYERFTREENEGALEQYK